MINLSLLKDALTGTYFPSLAKMPEQVLRSNLAAVANQMQRRHTYHVTQIQSGSTADADVLLDLHNAWTAELAKRVTSSSDTDANGS